MEAYSAGLMSQSFWFIEFKKVVKLISDGKSQNEIKHQFFDNLGSPPSAVCSGMLLLQVQAGSGLNILCCLLGGAAACKIGVCLFAQNILKRFVHPFKHGNAV